MQFFLLAIFPALHCDPRGGLEDMLAAAFTIGARPTRTQLVTGQGHFRIVNQVTLFGRLHDRKHDEVACRPHKIPFASSIGHFEDLYVVWHRTL